MGNKCLQLGPSITFLPHLDTFNNHLAVVFPARVPVIALVPEILALCLAAVNPRLALFTILKPAIRATDANVENQVECVVERSVAVARLGPGVDVTRATGIGEREVAPLPEPLLEICEQHSQQARVNIGEYVVLAPLDAKGVVVVCKGCVQCLVLNICPPPRIVRRVGPPVKGGRDDVIASFGVGSIVPTALGDVHLARRRPVAVGIVDGQHPYGWPQPEAGGKLGLNLDAAVRNPRTLSCANARRFHRIDDGSVCRVGDRDTIAQKRGRADAHLGQVEHGAVGGDELLVLESWANMQGSISNERVLL